MHLEKTNVTSRLLSTQCFKFVSDLFFFFWQIYEQLFLVHPFLFYKNIKNKLVICALKSESLAHIAVASEAGDRKSSIPVFPSQRNRSPGKVHWNSPHPHQWKPMFKCGGSRSVGNPRDMWKPYHSALIPISITEFRNRVRSQDRQVLWYRVCSILWETALHDWEQSQKEPLHILLTHPLRNHIPLMERSSDSAIK